VWVPILNEDHMILMKSILDEDVNLEEDGWKSESFFITTFLFPILREVDDISSRIDSIDVR
jgi:hypothetical protein